MDDYIEKLAEYEKVKQELQYYQRRERDMRAKLCEYELTGILEGSKTVERGPFKVTATAVINRALDIEALNTIWDELTWEEQEVVAFKPSLKVGGYKKIEAVGGKLLEAVTVKPGMAQLKVERLYEES